VTLLVRCGPLALRGNIGRIDQTGLLWLLDGNWLVELAPLAWRVPHGPAS
jgi:hypothetical protein